MRSRSSVVVAAGSWVVVLSLLLPTGRGAEINYWQHDPNTPGDWLDPNNWSLGVPDSDDCATIGNGGEAQVTASAPLVSWVSVGGGVGDGGSGAATVGPGGDLPVSNTIYVGSFETTGGSFTQTGGSTRGAQIAIDNGTYELTGGWIHIGRLEMEGPSACFHQSGGQILVSETEQLGYDMSGATFVQTAGTHTVGSLSMMGYGGAPGAYVISGGSLEAAVLDIQGPNGLAFAGSAGQITISDRLSFGAGSSLSAVPGATIHMNGGSLENKATDPAALADLRHLNMIFEADSYMLEVSGQDFGPVVEGYDDNFALGALILNGDGAGAVGLADKSDNRPDWEGIEALYVENLIVGAGCTLYLNGLNLYYLNADIDPAAIIEGGTPVQVPATPGDVNLDGIVNVGDLGIMGPHYRHTGRTWRTADLNCDGLVNVADLGILGANYGAGRGGAGAPGVPEPASAIVLLIGALGALSRRRCR